VTRPAARVHRTGVDRFAACFGIPADQHAAAEVFTYRRTSGGGNATLSVFDGTGARYCGPTGPASDRTITCRLPEGPGDGHPGNGRCFHRWPRREYSMTDTPVTAADVHEAAAQIKGVAHRTPVLRSRTLNDLVGAEVFLKCENFQRVGAFKFRGAYNAVSRLSPAQLAKGIAAYSSGNHAQAVALAARELDSTAVIVMPADTPQSKVDAVMGYGAEIVTYDRYTGDRVAIGQALAADRGLALIPPYEHPHVIAGQGTAALELIEEVGDLDALLVPVGGGGLIAGSATAVKALRPGVRVVGVEPQAGDDTKRSLEAGTRVSIPVPRTIADGQAASIPGELTFAINQRLVDEIVLVTDDDIRDAMRFAFDRLKIVVEPSGATALAAMLTGRLERTPARIGLVISGGNIGSQRFAELLRGT
jgi:threonine dehydratase